jgi:inorganic triphosphatase YgiF
MPENDSPERSGGLQAPVLSPPVEGAEKPGGTPVAEPPPEAEPPPGGAGVPTAAADEGHASDATSPGPSQASDPGRGTEIELKLLVDTERLPAFRDAPVIAANARNRGIRRHLRAVYYDTADRRLRKAGLSLRIRQSGARFIQTVKSGFLVDPLRRGEWEAAVPTAAPDLALALPFLPEKLQKSLSPEALQPVFATDIHRLSRLVQLPSGTVEVSFDHGTLKAGERILAVDEIELELKDGTPQTLYDLALRLMEHGPVRPSVRGKSDRGFDLADGRPPAAPKPERPVLDPEAPVDEAFAAILRGALLHLLRSLPAAEEGTNPEGVHQARVALRRLRSAFGLMDTVAASAPLVAFAAEAKWLANSLGAARDCDIFVDETLSSIEKALPGLDGFAGLRRLGEEKRSAGYAAARAAIADQRTSRFILQLGGWIELRGWRSDVSPEALGVLGDPVIGFAHRTLAALHAKVLKRGRRFDGMTPEARHKLRIAVKKLRYATDFLLPLYGARKPAKRFAAALAHLQEELGRYNDMATTRTIVDGFSGDAAGRSPAAGAVIGWQANGIALAEPGLRSAWRDFRKTPGPWPDAAGSEPA